MKYSAQGGGTSKWYLRLHARESRADTNLSDASGPMGCLPLRTKISNQVAAVNSTDGCVCRTVVMRCHPRDVRLTNHLLQVFDSLLNQSAQFSVLSPSKQIDHINVTQSASANGYGIPKVLSICRRLSKKSHYNIAIN